MKLESEILDLDLINNLGGEIAPLYDALSADCDQPGAHIAISSEGCVWAEATPRKNQYPINVVLGQVQAIPVPNTMSGDQIVDFVHRHLELFETVHLGHAVEWNGHNHVGTLTDEAQEALGQLVDAGGDPDLEASAPYHVDVWDWLFGTKDLVDVWPASVDLDSVVTAHEELLDLEINKEVDGDVRQCLLGEAENELYSDSPTIGHSHLEALLSAGRISSDEAEQYRAELANSQSGVAA